MKMSHIAVEIAFRSRVIVNSEMRKIKKGPAEIKLFVSLTHI
jgi:hypothetical protein